ncbi:MAG: peptidylprolyl isomerase [Ruminococcus sp.]|nr:peptidylprolyl isomerase [Ruminococcus sp.]
MRKIVAALTAALTAVTLSGCYAAPSNGMINYDFKEMSNDFIQLSGPKDGDTIAVFDTEYGEIRAVLYEEYAPNKVKSFIEKANAGDYNNSAVKGIQNDVYFLAGGQVNDKGQYIGRESDDELMPNEYSAELWPFKGALLGFSEKQGYCDARWFICNNDAENLTAEAINELKSNAADIEDEIRRAKTLELFDKFYEAGGVFGMAGEYTIFGQTYLGFDVVDKLTHIPADSMGQATAEVGIKSVTISEFKDGDKVEEFPLLHPEGLPEETSSNSDEQSGE